MTISVCCRARSPGEHVAAARRRTQRASVAQCGLAVALPRADARLRQPRPPADDADRRSRRVTRNGGEPMSTPQLDAARRLLALGLSVIPVPRPRPGVPPGEVGDGKVPAIVWR